VTGFPTNPPHPADDPFASGPDFDAAPDGLGAPDVQVTSTSVKVGFSYKDANGTLTTLSMTEELAGLDSALDRLDAAEARLSSAKRLTDEVLGQLMNAVADAASMLPATPARTSYHAAPAAADAAPAAAAGQPVSDIIEWQYTAKSGKQMPIYAPNPVVMNRDAFKAAVGALLAEQWVDPSHVVIFDNRPPQDRPSWCVGTVLLGKNSPLAAQLGANFRIGIVNFSTKTSELYIKFEEGFSALNPQVRQQLSQAATAAPSSQF
jgi:hypothetical protein